MIGKKQDQNVNSEGTGIQAGRDVQITQNFGLCVADVRELCREHLRSTFPALREEAIKVAKENVEKFARALEDKLIDRSGDIVVEKLADPDIQGAIRDAVLGSARRGPKVNTATLVDLIAERLSPSDSEFRDLVISEAISIVPKITRPQICHLSLYPFLDKNRIPNLQRLEQLEPLAQTVLRAVADGIDISPSQRRHMEYAGVCSVAEFMEVKIYDGWMKQHCGHLGYSNVEQFMKDMGVASPTSKILLDAYEKRWRMGEVTLTSVGQAIAVANLSTTMGKMDYSMWIN